MNCAELLVHLHSLGARVWLEDDHVRVSAPRGVLTDELRRELRVHRDEIREWLERRRDATHMYPPLGRQVRPKHLPLSYAQSRLWFLDQLEGTSTEYHIPIALRLRGALDLGALERSLQTIIARHESLRTPFAGVEGAAVQVIVPALPIPVPVEDLRALAAAAQAGAVRAAMRGAWAEPFDLGHGPVLRVKLLRLADAEHVLLTTFHHIVSDGWSVGVFTRELVRLYEAFQAGRESPLAPLAVQYADFALWQRSWLDEAGMAPGLAYWTAQLAECPEALA